MSFDDRGHRSQPDGGTIRRLARRVYVPLRRSFLLSFATFGLFLIVLAGAVIAPRGHDVLSGLFAASGVIIFTINVIGYFLYGFVKHRY